MPKRLWWRHLAAAPSKGALALGAKYEVHGADQAYARP